MENAAQALIIAGAVLIAILILSMGVYLRNSLNQSAEAYFDNLDTVELENIMRILLFMILQKEKK